MYVCIIDQEARIVKQKNIKSNPAAFLKAIDKYRDDIVVSAECMFTRYWLADLCEKENITFILGHALYMKAIHGGKAKNDRIDAYKIAYLLRGGNIPMAYVYPPEMRATRDLMRRRNHLVRKRAELLAHIQNTNHQYNLPPLVKNIRYKGNREGLIEHFRKVPQGADLCILQQAGKACKGISGKDLRTCRQEDRQCTSEVGFFRSRGDNFRRCP
jgi:hypothetical protein